MSYDHKVKTLKVRYRIDSESLETYLRAAGMGTDNCSEHLLKYLSEIEAEFLIKSVSCDSAAIGKDIVFYNGIIAKRINY